MENEARASSDEATLAEFLAEEFVRAGDPGRKISPRALKAIRTHLGMDVAFISEFRDGKRIFRYVDSATEESPIEVGESDHLDESYCQRVVEGRLPQLIRDASEEPAARELNATTTLPVGAHLSVPIVLSNGETYGTFCCFSYAPDQSLTERDLAVMKVFAELVAEEVDRERQIQRERYEIYQRVRGVISGEGLEVVFQPIYDLVEGAPAGFESLSRFTQEPVQGPDTWFNEAAMVGLAEALDLAAVSASVSSLQSLPEAAFLTVNVTPTTAASEGLNKALENVDPTRVVVELTEHASVVSYETLTVSLARLRRNGLRLAVDDAGAGYSSFRHILRLEPDFIKLDMDITRGIHIDPAKRALATALIGFARETNSTLIAEGVESEEELAVLRSLGVTLAQGYYLGKPGKLPIAG